MTNLIKQIGQLFIVGYPGDSPPRPFLNFIGEENIGGVILFEDNCTDYAKTRENIEVIRRCHTIEWPFIAIDQEGGAVCRLRGAPAEYRAAAAYGAEGNVERFKEEYKRVAVYIESLGINLNLAPVADICITGQTSCLKDRCFGSDPETVSSFVRASVEVAHAAGLLCCLKHFPGLGPSRKDPHKETAVVEYDIVAWEQHDRLPFVTGLEAGADLVMTTHLLAPKLDTQIITGSEEVVNKLLRAELGFEGPIITDDLAMTGAAALGDIGDRTIAAYQAGHDLLLFDQNYEVAAEAYECFVGAVSEGEIDPARLRASLARIVGLKFKLERSVAP